MILREEGLEVSCGHGLYRALSGTSSRNVGKGRAKSDPEEDPLFAISLFHYFASIFITENRHCIRYGNILPSLYHLTVILLEKPRKLARGYVKKDRNDGLKNAFR